MSNLFLRAALVGCATAGVAAAQTQPPPPPIAVPLPTPTLTVRVTQPAPGKMVLKTFDVAELVCPPADCPLAKPGTDPAMVAAAKAYTEVRAEELMKAVRGGTDRGCWDEFGGAGKLAVTTDGRSLVVSNTAAVVDKVGACMETLRKLHSAQVKVDVVIFTVPSKNEAMVKLFGDKGHAAVSADEMNLLLRELKASCEVNVLSCPKLVMLNKQTGYFQVGGQMALPAPAGGPVTFRPVGLSTRVTPDVSADLKSVALALEFEHSVAVGGPVPAIDSQQVKANLMLSDGGTMAVKVGTRKVERKMEMRAPVVSDIPYIGRLFRTVSVCSQPTDTVAVITATRVSECDVAARPPLAVAPPVMATAVRGVPVPAPVALPPAAVFPQPMRFVAADGLERVGVNFNTLTANTLPKAVTGVRVTAPPAVTLVRFAPDVACVAGGCVGTTIGSSTRATDDTLMTAYRAACAAGKKEEAARLALQLLANDPTCFGK